MRGQRLNFAFLNVGHFLDHLFMLIFATVAALRLTEEWGMSYAALIPYATPGFIAFGICALPAGWLADKWSREGMMVIFFIGIGASSIATALANTPIQMALGLLAIGAFAAIYHPVGLAMVVHGREKTGVPLAVNGVFGNLGVAAAALITGYFIDTGGWRNAFVLPGMISVGLGVVYAAIVRVGREQRVYDRAATVATESTSRGAASVERSVFVRLFSIIMLTTAIGGIIFQGTTFALPKIFDERLTDIAGSATAIGGYAFLVFAIAAIAQLYVGYLLDRHSARTIFAVIAGLQAVLFAIMYQLTGLAALLVSTAFMLVVFGQIPINDVLVGRITKSEWRARMYGIRFILNFTVMASTLPVIAGIHANWGFGMLFVAMAVAASATFAAVLMLPRTGAIRAQPMTA
ncbi:MAG: MFS transporter [Rhodospirillaceae bacterium]|nr:MFS transporter [Rhodospirillaceae bacterium]